MSESIKVQKRGRKKKSDLLRIEENDLKEEIKKDEFEKRDTSFFEENVMKEKVEEEEVDQEEEEKVEEEEIDQEEVEEEKVEEEEVEQEEVQEEQKIKKKRGRKPKNEKEKENNDIKDDETTPITNNEEETYKKRGRKPRPKEKIYNIKEISYENYDEDKNETLILHLPIKSSDIFSSNTPKGINVQKTPIATYNLDGSCEQTPYQIQNINENTKYEDILKSTQIEKKNSTIIFEDNLEENGVNLIDEYDKKVKEYKEFKLGDYVKMVSNQNKVNNEDDIIHGGNGALLKELESEQSNVTNFKVNPFMESTHLEEEIIQEHTNKINKKNLKNIMVEFINSNMYQEWPDQTNIHCWWCCHQFDGPPCTLPEYIRRDKFYVSGCFCSFNCAASYNFNKNDNGVWERYTLLNLMYKKLYNLSFIKIEMAPPREVLKMFGGYMDITEFRNYCIKQDRKFQVIKPPLISIIPKIEEHIYPKNKVVNEHIVNNTQTKLKLTRSKPLIAEKSTIQTFMNITAKKNDDE